MKNNCLYCNKLCSGKRCKNCYLLKDNPAFNASSRLKMAHHKENHPLWIGGRPKCIDCSKQLARYDATRCKKCARQGELHPNYKDGSSKSPYPLEFNSNLKETIRKRDNYTCQNCNMFEEEHIIVFGSNLEVHHIDYNKNNLDNKNLITLCKSCNIRANYNRIYWISFYRGKITCLAN